jgi:hypothetical protein
VEVGLAYPPLSALGDASPGSKTGMDLVDRINGFVRCVFFIGGLELYRN